MSQKILINHVSILSKDLDESVDFYTDIFDMKPIPTPAFEVPVKWLQAGSIQLHLFERDMEAVEFYHFGITVDNFEEIYDYASENEIFARWDRYSDAHIFKLPDGAAQMYIHDPAGNLIECNHSNIENLRSDIIAVSDDRKDFKQQSWGGGVSTLGI